MKNALVFIVLSFCFAGPVFGIISISGQANNFGGSDVLTISVKLSGVPAAEVTSDYSAFFNTRVRARLPYLADFSSNFVPIVNYGEIPDIDLLPESTYEILYLNAEGAETEVIVGTETLKSFSFSVQLRDLTGNNFSNISNSTTGIGVDFYILKAGTTDIDNGVTTGRVDISSDNIVAASSPSGLEVNAGDSMVSVSWSQQNTNINYYNVDTKVIVADNALPSGTTVLLFERGVNDYSLDALLANEAKDDAMCTYDDGIADGAGCLSACDNGAAAIQKIAYLDIEEIMQGNDYRNGLIQIKTANSSENSVMFTGLTNDKQYRAVAVFNPNQINLQAATCRSATPAEEFSLQGAFAGGSPRTTTKIPCMITQVSASEWGQQDLDLFRFVRDRWFAKAENSLHIISHYYSTSASLEKPLGKNSFFRGVLYGVFAPVAILLSWAF